MSAIDRGAPGQKPENAGVSLSRRGFVAGGLAAASVFALGGIASACPTQTPIRPPGAQDEAAFLGACIRCDRCRSVCPEHAIVLAKLEEGVIAARTPKMEFREGFCTTCDGEYRCAAVCPTQAIAPGFDMLTQAIGTAVVDERECLLYRGVSSACSKQCVTACPYEALSFADDVGLRVDEALCNGCGACEATCPSSSYGGSTGSSRKGINVEGRRR